VKSQLQPERTPCGVIVLSRDGTEVLLKTTEAGFAFPHVDIQRSVRVAESLTAALKTTWACDAVCLFSATALSPGGDSNGNHYEVMDCWDCERRVDGAAWKPITSLSRNSFRNPTEFVVLERSLHQLDDYEHDPSSPFAQRGWLASLLQWAAAVVCPLGLELTERFRQYNASDAFNLMRLETTGPAIWFKAVGEPNLQELVITLKLAELFPTFLAEIIGKKPEWNAWLSREVEGTSLGETKDLTSWERAASDLARLQIESISRIDAILGSGSHDLRAITLLTSVNPFFELVAQLMEEQPKVHPPALSGPELNLLQVRVKNSLTLLDSLRIPNTLGHLDLNPWNVVVSGDRCVFLDWAEAYVGHPFLSFEYLLEHFRRAVGPNVTAESNFVSAYKGPWHQLLSEDLTSKALALAPLVAVFAYAAGTGAGKNEERLRDPQVMGYCRSLVRRMNREAIQLMERRT
jgi:Phosphotransferase enzyme family